MVAIGTSLSYDVAERRVIGSALKGFFPDDLDDDTLTCPKRRQILSEIRELTDGDHVRMKEAGGLSRSRTGR